MVVMMMEEEERGPLSAMRMTRTADNVSRERMRGRRTS